MWLKIIGRHYTHLPLQVLPKVRWEIAIGIAIMSRIGLIILTWRAHSSPDSLCTDNNLVHAICLPCTFMYESISANLWLKLQYNQYLNRNGIEASSNSFCPSPDPVLVILYLWIYFLKLYYSIKAFQWFPRLIWSFCGLIIEKSLSIIAMEWASKRKYAGSGTIQCHKTWTERKARRRAITDINDTFMIWARQETNWFLG